MAGSGERSEGVPDAWIGESVEVGIRDGGGFTGLLQEVNDRGVVLSYSPSGSPVARTLFYPWGALRVIRLLED
ncbi:MAG: hypothetical protein H0V53_04840 [Rubrobacter sp.]|nr:hypothetical protein [Rubrobacter sp.]